MGFREANKWWVAPANYTPEVTDTFKFAPNIEILDTTLRDGEQQPGVVLSRQDKVAIAKKLDAIGVHRIEAGTPAVSKEDEDAIREICDLGLNAKIYCFTRNVVADIKLAKSCGVHGVLAEVPGSEHQLKSGMNWDKDRAIKAACETTLAAKELGLKVTFFPADGSRADLNFLLDTLSAIKEGGHMDSVVLVDTFGAFSPEGAAYTVRKMKERLGMPVECHFHDDFGMSVATTVAGLMAGAEVAHVTVNGLGERCGNTPMEPLLVALQCLYGLDLGIDLTKLIDLSKDVEKRSGVPVSKTSPVVGDNIFGWETGLPVGYWKNAKDTDPLIMLPYMWTLVNQRAPYIYTGKKSGVANMQLVAEELGQELDKDAAKILLTQVKDMAIRLKRDISREEFKALLDALQQA